MRAAWLLMLVAGCSRGVEDTVAGRDATDWLIRASLDLRGVRPSVAELEAVLDDPTRAEAAVLALMDDDRFPDRVGDLWSELYLTRIESFPVPYDETGLDRRGHSEADYIRSVGDAPAQTFAHIAREDLPWTELVLGDWAMVNEVLAAMWPLSYPEGGEGWEVGAWTDGRPVAGLLSSNSLWWTYTTTESNGNRGRAAEVARLFVCSDFANVQVSFDDSLDLLDEEAVRNAVRTHTSCVGCHDIIDPLAGYLYGFYYFDRELLVDASVYHPERELLYREITELDPAHGGAAGYTLEDLAFQLASDSRYPDCAVEQAWELLIRRAPGVADEPDRVAVREAFLGAGLTPRALLTAMVTLPAYRGDSPDDGDVALRHPAPELLASQIEDLTGFSWTYEDTPLLWRTTEGLRGLAGGADGIQRKRHEDLPSPTSLLVLERLAEAASSHVVIHDMEHADAPRLFEHIDFEETPNRGRAAMVDQIVALHLRLYGHRVDRGGQEVEAALDLWSSLYDVEQSAPAAWAGLLSALLRDPAFLLF